MSGPGKVCGAGFSKENFVVFVQLRGLDTILRSAGRGSGFGADDHEVLTVSGSAAYPAPVSRSRRCRGSFRTPAGSFLGIVLEWIPLFYLGTVIVVSGNPNSVRNSSDAHAILVCASNASMLTTMQPSNI